MAMRRNPIKSFIRNSFMPTLKKFSILPVDHPGLKFRLRLRSINSVLFLPVGRLNMLTVFLFLFTGFGLISLAIQSETDSPRQLISGAVGFIIFLASTGYIFWNMGEPKTPLEKDQLLVSSTGVINPTRVTKRHPERVELYQRLVTALGANGYRPSDALQNAGGLILSGALNENDMDLLVVALQRGAVTTSEITSLVEELRKNAVMPLINGML